MKKIVKMLAFVLVLAMMLSACAQPAAEPAPTNAVAAEPAPAPAEPEAEKKAIYTPGTYTATAGGKKDLITAAVTFSEDAIVSIEILESNETKGVADVVYDVMVNEIIEYQSINVDVVTNATGTSSAVKRIVMDCAAQAGASVDALNVPVEYEVPAETNLTADVVIVGAGGAGMTAAVAATQQGASVIMIEKGGFAGGNSRVCGGIYNVYNPELQSKVEMTAANRATIENAINATPINDDHAALMAEVRKEYEAHLAAGNTWMFDSVNWHALQTWSGGAFVGDIDLIKNYTAQAVECLDWLNSMDFEWMDFVVFGGGALWTRTMTPADPLGSTFFKVYEKQLEGKDCELLVETTAYEIIMENGRAVGVKATDNKTGAEYTISANKGVIISSGGFGGNKEMLQEYNTSGKWDDLSNTMTSNMGSITGDGIRMGIAAGAAVRDMDQIQLLHMYRPERDLASSASPLRSIGAEAYLFINKEGNRFAREDGRRDEISLAALAQPDGEYWIVCSGNALNECETIVDNNNRPLDYLLERGILFGGDTLEELCGKINIDYNNAQAAIDKYNDLVDANATTDEFGRAEFSYKFTEGPWVAWLACPAIHHTMGGLVINTNAEVLDTNGNVIPGLFAAGEVTGGIHGSNRLGGNAVVDFVVHGRLAGTNAAK